MNNKLKFYVMVGNIGTGKSTWVRRQKNCLVVSRDKLRYMLGNDIYLFDPKLEPTIFDCENAILNHLMMCGCYNIIVDEVGINKEMRKKYIGLAKPFGYEVIAVEMPKDRKKDCVDKRMHGESRGYNREIWEQVWDKFDSKYEEPSFEEGFDKIIKVKEIVDAIY